MFWFRFFGWKARDNNAQTTYARYADADSDKAKLTLFESCEFVFEEDSKENVEDVGVPLTRGSRRSALDYSRTGYSVDIGPEAVIRFSLDMFSEPSFQLASLLKGYSDIVTLHRGSNARILKALRKGSEETVVFKLYEKSVILNSQNQLESALKELDILKKGFTFGFVELLDVFEDERVLLFSLKEYSKGSLMAVMHDFGGCMSEAECVRFLVKPLVEALHEMHKNNIIHRNLKPEHILYDEKFRLHICDFYNAGIMGKDTFTDRKGSLAYMAPEMLAKPSPEEIFLTALTHGVDESELPSYNEKVDVWSMGVIIVEALTGMQPFVSDSCEGMSKVLSDYFSNMECSNPLKKIKNSDCYTSNAIDFLSKIFRVDPNDRATASDLIHHSWLQIND